MECIVCLIVCVFDLFGDRYKRIDVLRLSKLKGILR